MAGFEAVGVVLGAIPLFVAAAEHCRDTLDKVDRFFQKERILELYIENLVTHDAKLRLYLQGVVGRTSLSAAVQKSLVDDPGGPLWQTVDVSRQLQRQLREGASILHMIMRRMTEILVNQVKSDRTIPWMDGNQDPAAKLRLLVAQAKTTGNSRLQYFWDRLVFSWRSPGRNKILAGIEYCNDELLKIIIAVDVSSPYHRKQQVRKAHASWQGRVNAEQLFQVLSTSCNCPTKISHYAKLRLRPLTDDGDRCHVKFHGFLQQPTPISCAVIIDVDCQRTMATVTLSQDTEPAVILPSGHQIVQDLCSAVKTAYRHNHLIALTIDASRTLLETGRKQLPRPVNMTHNISLEEFFHYLEAAKDTLWVRKERLILAIVLAYAALQYHDSPWLCKGLDIEHVLFLTENPEQAVIRISPARYLLQRPYLSTRLCSVQPRISADHHRNPELFALGVVLLELYRNKSLIPRSAAAQTQRAAAIESLFQAKDDCSMSASYFDAIRFCICPKPNPISRSTLFADEGFRELYYLNVILPLEEELDENFEIEPTFWDDL